MPRAAGGAAAAVAMLGNTFDTEEGVVLEGTLRLRRGRAGGKAPRVGLYVECGRDRGAALLAGPGGSAELGPIRADGTGFKCDKRVDRQVDLGTAPRFRLLLKHFLVELYLNDVLMECYSLPARATGRIGLIRGKGKDTVTDLKAWQ